MNDTFFKVVLVIFVIGILLYFSSRKTSRYEGLENMTDASGNNTGDAGNAEKYAAEIKSFATKIQDSLLVGKYRKDYENIVINMDELVDGLMLKTLLSARSGQEDSGFLIKKLELLNILNNSKGSLNNVMKYIDKQPNI